MMDFFTNYLFVSLLLLSIPNFTPAQELVWHQLGGPMGGVVGDMAINSKGDIYVGVYTNLFNQIYEGIYRSTDKGETWKKFENTVDQFEVYSIYINRKDDIFVGTNYRDRLYLSTNNGETWEVINDGYNTAECWAIGENKDGSVMFAGDGQFGKLYRSTNSGDNWELSANLPVLAFAADSSNNVYCGTFIGLYKSTDDGLTWDTTGLTSIPVNAMLINDTGGIVCGTGYYSGGQGVFYSSDTGKTWTSIGLSDKNVMSLAFTSYGSLLAGVNEGGIYETTDMGINWVEHNNGLYEKQAFRLKVNSNDDIFIGSEAEGVFRSTDKGESFKEVGLPISGVYNIDFIGDSLIIAGTVSGVQKYNRITKEWKNIGLAFVLAVGTDAEGNILAGTNGEGLFQSSDMGENWINICKTPYILNVKKIDKTILAATDTGLIRSTNDGNNWEYTPVKCGVDNNAIEVNNYGDVWAVGYLGKLYNSTNSGLSFNLVDSIGFIYVDRNNLYVNDSLIFFGEIVTKSNIVYSVDYGITWQKKYAYNGSNSVGGKDNYIFCSRPHDLLYTKDIGSTWDSIPYPQKFYGYVKEIEFDNKGQMFFGTSSQGLYEMNFVVGVNEDFPSVKDFTLYPLYPNPFNPTVTVEYNLPADLKIKITIYNVLGEVIKSLELFGQKGINLERISFDNLAGGIYLVAIEGKDIFAVQKAAFVK